MGILFNVFSFPFLHSPIDLLYFLMVVDEIAKSGNRTSTNKKPFISVYQRRKTSALRGTTLFMEDLHALIRYETALLSLYPARITAGESVCVYFFH